MSHAAVALLSGWGARYKKSKQPGPHPLTPNLKVTSLSDSGNVTGLSARVAALKKSSNTRSIVLLKSAHIHVCIYIYMDDWNALEPLVLIGVSSSNYFPLVTKPSNWKSPSRHPAQSTILRPHQWLDPTPGCCSWTVPPAKWDGQNPQIWDRLQSNQHLLLFWFHSNLQ